jgi:rhodanese-related sulfurtransferase
MSGGILSDELKRSLGVENEAEVLAQPRKKQKEKKRSKSKGPARPVLKETARKKKSVDRLKGAAEQAEEQARLFERISAVQLGPGAALQSSRSLSRKAKPVRELREAQPVEEEEEDDEGPIVVVRKRPRRVVTAAAAPVPRKELAVPRKTAVAVAAPAEKKPEPSRAARVMSNRPAAMIEHRQVRISLSILSAHSN